jgi:transcriptional regulator with XRE-family HTH domain
MQTAVTIPDAVGAFVSSVRREHGITLDQIAHAGRSYGASWSASSVSNIERGQASLTLPSLVLLALALGEVLGRPLALSSLLGEADVIELATGAQSPVKRSWIDSVLAGAPVTLSPALALDDEDWELHEDLEDEVLNRMRESRGREMTDVEKNGNLAQMLDQSQTPPERRGSSPARDNAGTLAEERAAKKLGLTIARLQRAAVGIWGRSLEEESSRRAGRDSSPQARGRVTRLLIEEIRESMKEER